MSSNALLAMLVLLSLLQRQLTIHGALLAQSLATFALQALTQYLEMPHLASHAMVDSMVLMLEWHKLSALDHVTLATTAHLVVHLPLKTHAEMQMCIAQLPQHMELLRPSLFLLDSIQSHLMHHTMHEAHSALAVEEMESHALHSTLVDHA
jgi:hypothetical protein